MSSTFETLPDEIIMIIFKYSGDVYTIFRTFLGLNHRLNNILIDKRLHLFADFLYINTNNVILTDYYKSNVFENVCYKLLSMNSPIDKKELDHCFESLINFHIKERFNRLGEQVQSNLVTFESIRQQISDSEIVDIDNQLKNLFFDLQNNDFTIESIKQIESFVLTKAARLECDNRETSQFNLAKALNQLLLHYLNKTDSSLESFINRIYYMFHQSCMQCKSESFINPITEMLKALIISNTGLLNNRDITNTVDSSVCFFLLYSIYELRYSYYAPPDLFINMKCYDAVIDLLLFSIQCQKQTNNDENWAQQSLFHILEMIYTKKVICQSTVFIHYVQWAILQIIIDENILTSTETWHENEDNEFGLILDNLIKANRFALVFMLYSHLPAVQSYFNKPNNIRRNVNMLTGSRKRREFFKTLMDVKPLKSWIVSKDLLFLLLQKKERTLLEKLFKLSSLIINQVDENGNDPLLYICLKVRGCRHRIIKLLITMGCDLQRRNLNGENFFDAIQLERNRSLLKDLLENQIIKIDDESGEIQANLYDYHQRIDSCNENTLTDDM